MLANGDNPGGSRRSPLWRLRDGHGMLGVLLDATFALPEPHHALHQVHHRLPLPCWNTNERLNREHAFVKSWWFA